MCVCVCVCVWGGAGGIKRFWGCTCGHVKISVNGVWLVVCVPVCTLCARGGGQCVLHGKVRDSETPFLRPTHWTEAFGYWYDVSEYACRNMNGQVCTVASTRHAGVRDAGS